MSIPSKEHIGSIVTDFLQDGRLYNFDAIKSQVKSQASMTAEDLKKKNRSGSRLKWLARLETVLTDLKRRGLIAMPKSDRYRITDAGKKKEVADEPSDETQSKSDRMGEKLRSMFQMLNGANAAPAVAVVSKTEVDSVPSRNELSLIILRSMQDGKIYTRGDFRAAVRSKINFSAALLEERCPSGELKWENEVAWAVNYLFKNGYIERPMKAHYRITEAGKKFLARNNF